ncbi:50S ribosomal protein L25/general stress protein Ctc [Herbiconiux sp. KACC 21604]|uniref:50S ribosomal protein L25/general stress protein Ctc n=1 Tax=unclassified Herbiconiux TaxID=2618217 RepID=UPI0014926C77|nr:50S ribosomal protein L25/general stress protein Ctc [Herbiconiux sp. SALV-R1]QJU54013.1 50S ribosomal protein L25/general stress protein Ctc [Herbiconiux sp. SALV-R1]WPO85045.1 50S ribosomal protein L25/general stress protein Ctc [Herbiconiux sp. KACC 21604]
MADENKVSAEVRTQFGKGAARRIRAAHKIPAVIYGHGTDPQHVTLPGHQTALILRKANQVLELDIDGTEQLALVKDVQKDPVLQIIEHIDLIVVRKGEKVQVEVPVHLEGESFSGTIATQDAATVLLEVEATNIPERIVLSIEGLEEGTLVHAKELELPKGATLLSEEDMVVVGITVPVADTDDEAPAEGEGEEESVTPEPEAE